MTDIIDLIDQATGCQLDSCGRSLGASPSGDFCSPAHQQAWHEERADLFAGYTSAERGDGLGDFRYQATRADYPPMGAFFCSVAACRRPAIGPGPCPLHQPPASGDRPPYTHTFTHGEPDDGGQFPIMPTHTVTERWDGDVPAGMSLLRGVHADLGQRLRIESGGAAPEDVVVVEIVHGGVLVTPVPDFGGVLRGLAAAFQGAGEAAEEAAAAVASMPADPRARALELRRNRNTGPAARQRAPRTIQARGCS